MSGMRSGGKSSAIDELLKIIRVRFSESGTWKISVSEFMKATGLRQEEFYRKLYTQRNRISEIAPSEFSPENVHDMVLLLTELYGQTAVSPFEETGIILSFDAQTLLMEIFVFQLSQTLGRHEIDIPEFHAMLRAFNSVNRAVATYIDYFFDLKQLVETIARDFSRRRYQMFYQLVELNASEYLKRLMRTKVLSADGLLSLVESRLRKAAVGGESEERRAPESDIEKALKTFGMSEIPETREQLRASYMVLVKTYHPDVNPSGLEICQQINNAYAMLQNHLGGQRP